jgi:hypothetical protein
MYNATQGDQQGQGGADQGQSSASDAEVTDVDFEEVKDAK